MSAVEPVLVLIPAYNEELSIAGVVCAARGAGYDVCVVDDGSQDRTAECALDAGAVVLCMPLNVGVGGALRCGFRYAVREGYRTVVQVDGDGQHDVRDVALLLQALERNRAEMVIGSRFLAGPDEYRVGRSRRWAMRRLARRAERATNTTITDATSGFRAIGLPLLEAFADDYPVEYLGDTAEALVIAGGRGARVVEQATTMTPRMAGRASAGRIASSWYTVRVLVAIFLMHHRRTRPPRALPDDHGVGR